MNKLCPICNITQLAIVTNLSDKEISILRILELPESICKPCYINKLSEMKKPLKEELIHLNKTYENAKAVYTEASKNYNTKSILFRYIDYNLFIITEGIKKKKSSINKHLKSDQKPEVYKPTKVELLAKKLIASLSKEQQMAMFKTFQNN